jgi:putative membrane-bound dehydrogenase-like protein
MRRLLPIACAIAISLVGHSPADTPLKDRLKSPPPTEPAAALRTFQTRDGFRMELVAHEPQVTSPVAAAYDEDGRLYVVEMRDYPDPLKPGEKPLGRVRLLEDRDEDGVYETATVFADGLPWPTGICCWNGGVFVTAAPDIWYLKDTKGTGTADVRKKVFTGFVVYNVQALVNGLQWGVDNRIYGVTAGNGGEIRPADKPDAKPVSVRGRDFRFDPKTLLFEAISGTAQFGNAFDDWYNRFLSANRLVAGHVVLPSHALARNPALSVSKVVQDCAAEGENIPLPMYQISPAEPWRVVRSEQYHAEGVKLPESEMVAKGVFTSGSGITIYRGNAYPAKYRGQAFLANPAGNLVHRRSLTPNGATFVATRIDKGSEIVASTDNWFRPVNFVNAPDGTLHIIDMYREIVEHPWSIPDDIKAHLDLTSGRDRGRIYRLAPPGYKYLPPPRLSKATTAELVKLLGHPNAWHRETAQRLLYQRDDLEAIPLLRALAADSESAALARMHALWALDALAALASRDIFAALSDAAAGVREHALRLAEPRLAKAPPLAVVARKLADDPDPHVRFQAAIALGESASDYTVRDLAILLQRDADDPWLRVAVLSSVKDRELKLLDELLNVDKFTASDDGLATLKLLAATVGARAKAREPEALLKRVVATEVSAKVRVAVVQALGDGLLRAGQTFQMFKLEPGSPEHKLVAGLFRSAVQTAAAADSPTAARARAAGLLVHVPFAECKPAFESLLDPAGPSELQLAAIRALRSVPADEVPGLVLRHWKNYTPAVRQDALTTLTGRAAWSLTLLNAVANKTVASADLGTVPRAVLLNHRDVKVRERATELIGKATSAARADVIDRYKPVLTQKGDPARGLAVFKRECASCHYAAGVGTSIGPAIAAVGTRTPDALLTAILDPNREVDPRYLAYTVQTVDGRTLSGIIAAETATTVTLRRADGTDTVLRSRIEDLRSVGVSLMPEGLEKTIPPADMTDLLAFLATVK